MPTGIAWTDETWNAITGCTKVSAGCKHCYAERMAKRLAGRFGYPADEPFRVTLHPEKLELPLQWRKPRRIFVNSMSDLFHKDVPDEFIGHVFDVMLRASWHTFQVLTKRPERMAEWCQRKYPMPLPNVWLGTSVENQATAVVRIPLLLETPAAVRWVSAEPLLGRLDLPVACPVDDDTWAELKADEDVDGPGEPEMFVEECEAENDWINFGHRLVYNPEHEEWERNRLEVAHWRAFKQGIDWVVTGCESGPGARPMDLDWARRIRADCEVAGVPFFFKQAMVDGHKVETPELDGRRWVEYPGNVR